MKKIFTILIFSMLFLNVSSVFAHEHNFDETKQLIDSGISCDKLTDEQLEAIGDYYMEQMHPGEAHEMMDNMMGGEGSDSLKQVHINMAKRLYCNDNIYVGYGMMGSGGMMGSYPTSYAYSNYGYWNILWLIFLIGVIVLIIWLIFKLTKKGEESETPINILQKRYVKGDISKKQFDEMKKELKK